MKSKRKAAAMEDENVSAEQSAADVVNGVALPKVRREPHRNGSMADRRFALFSDVCSGVTTASERMLIRSLTIISYSQSLIVDIH